MSHCAASIRSIALISFLAVGASALVPAAAQQMRSTLPSTPLRIASIDGTKIPATGGRNAPSMTFDSAKGRFSATVGCNRIGGGYSVDGEQLRFSKTFATRMACPGALGQRERAFLAALERVRGWRVDKRGLMLVDASAQPAIGLSAR